MDNLKIVFVLVCLVKYSYSQSKPGVIGISGAIEEPKILVPTGTNTKTKNIQYSSVSKYIYCLSSYH